MQLEQWKNQGHYFRYKDQYPIFYRREGQGPTLLLLHGLPTASWDWHKIWPQLIQYFEVVAPDFIGFGYSDKPAGYPYSIMDQSDLIEALMAHLELREAHVFAHDYGDSVFQELLARHMDRLVNKSQGLYLHDAVLLNGGLFPETHHALPIQKLMVSPIGFLFTPFLNKNKLRKSFQRIFGPKTKATAKEIDEFYSLIEYNKGR
ncbi:MAG: alpha/beta hydrolase, partial [Bacteroidota bacterium]